MLTGSTKQSVTVPDILPNLVKIDPGKIPSPFVYKNDTILDSSPQTTQFNKKNVNPTSEPTTPYRKLKVF
jgi:hypothetical protein